MFLRTLRRLGYRDTHRFITHGPKPTCLIVHPVRSGTNRELEIWKAEEALRLVQACGWDAFEGLSEPRGGWRRENEEGAESVKQLTGVDGVSMWSSAIEEKFHEFDCDDENFLDAGRRRQFAESLIVRMHKTSAETFFEAGKTEELLVQGIGKSRTPPGFVVINAQLTPTQLLRLNVLAGQALLAWKSRRAGELQRAGRLQQLTGYMPEDEHEKYEFRTQNHVPAYIEVIDRNRLIMEALYKQSQHRIVRGEVAGSSTNTGSTGSILKRQLELQKIMWLGKNLVPSNASSIDPRFTDALNKYVGGFKENVTFQNVVLDASQRRLGKSNRQYINDLIKFQLLRLKKRVQKQRLHREQLMGSDNALHIALVGYVNVGKTTLFNTLTNELAAVKRAKDNLLSAADRRALIAAATQPEDPAGLLESGSPSPAQLDSGGTDSAVAEPDRAHSALMESLTTSEAVTVRRRRLLAQAQVTETLELPLETVETRASRVRLPSGLEVVVHDTPGFIENCPYFMFETFQGAFDFLRNCHVLLHVRDASCPFHEHQAQVVQEALLLAGLQDADVKDVWTKADLSRTGQDQAGSVSGLTGEGLSELVELLDTYSGQILRKRKFRLHFSLSHAPKLLKTLRECVDVVYDESYEISDSGEELSIQLFAGPNEEGRLRARLAADFADVQLALLEHLEEGDQLSDWARIEYRHMQQTVTGEDILLFTNVTVEAVRKELEISPNTRTTPLSLKEAMTHDAQFSKIPFAKYCLLDMQAEAELKPQDAEVFEAVVFGGILGNVFVNEDGSYGSDDKTSKVRVLGFDDNRRHLGELQMTTDTAVLVTKMVLRQGKTLETIPFIDHPEIPVSEDCTDVTEMEGFRYVAGYDGQPVLPQGMKQLLAASMDWDLADEL